jgi:hypothetical protein
MLIGFAFFSMILQFHLGPPYILFNFVPCFPAAEGPPSVLLGLKHLSIYCNIQQCGTYTIPLHLYTGLDSICCICVRTGILYSSVHCVCVAIEFIHLKIPLVTKLYMQLYRNDYVAAVTFFQLIE